MPRYPLSLIFAAISLLLLGRQGIGADGAGLAEALIDTAHSTAAAPVGTLLIIGRLVTYAALANRDQVTTR